MGTVQPIQMMGHCLWLIFAMAGAIAQTNSDSETFLVCGPHEDRLPVPRKCLKPDGSVYNPVSMIGWTRQQVDSFFGTPSRELWRARCSGIIVGCNEGQIRQKLRYDTQPIGTDVVFVGETVVTVESTPSMRSKKSRKWATFAQMAGAIAGTAYVIKVCNDVGTKPLLFLTGYDLQTLRACQAMGF